MLSSHLLNLNQLFNSDHASQGKEAASFHFNFLFPRFSYLNYQAVFVHKQRKDKQNLTHISRFLLADLIFHDSFWLGNWYPSIVCKIRK